jgi:hypothetical protein
MGIVTLIAWIAGIYLGIGILLQIVTISWSIVFSNKHPEYKITYSYAKIVFSIFSWPFLIFFTLMEK